MSYLRWTQLPPTAHPSPHTFFPVLGCGGVAGVWFSNLHENACFLSVCLICVWKRHGNLLASFLLRKTATIVIGNLPFWKDSYVSEQKLDGPHIWYSRVGFPWIPEFCASQLVHVSSEAVPQHPLVAVKLINLNFPDQKISSTCKYNAFIFFFNFGVVPFLEGGLLI